MCITVCSVDERVDERTHFCGWSKFRTTRGGCLRLAPPSSDFIGLCSDHDCNCWCCRFIAIRGALDVIRTALLPPRPHSSVKVNSQLGEINHLILSNEAVVTGDGRWLIGCSAIISVDLACVSKLLLRRSGIPFSNTCKHCVIFGTITGANIDL